MTIVISLETGRHFLMFSLNITCVKFAVVSILSKNFVILVQNYFRQCLRFDLTGLAPTLFLKSFIPSRVVCVGVAKVSFFSFLPNLF